MSIPFILIWAAQMLFSRTHGVVTTLASANVVPGHPFTLSCSVATAAGDSVRQVSWLAPAGGLLTAYQPGDPPLVSVGRPDVRLEGGHSDTTSAVTVAAAGPGSQGCYVCVFHIYPTGRQEGRTCITLTSTVFLEGGGVALSGGVARLRCHYTGDQESVRQVVWRRFGGGGDSPLLASYSGKGQPLVEEALRGRAGLSSSLGESQLTLGPLQPQDQGCYTCTLHTFPEGSRSNSTCLVVYVLPVPEISSITRSSGVVEANCTTDSRPASNVTWSVAGDNQTAGPPNVSYEQLGGGIVRVTSTLLIQSELLKQLSVKCLVHHPGLDQPLAVAVSAGQGVAVAITVSAVVLVLLLCL